MAHSDVVHSAKVQTNRDFFDVPQATYRVENRSEPNWVMAIGGLFTLAGASCVIGLFVLSVVMHRVVISSGDSRMSFILLAIAIALSASLLLLEYAQITALRGFRRLREHNALRVNAILSLLIMLTIGFIHPLAGLIVPTVAAIGVFALRRLAQSPFSEAYWVFQPNEATAIMAGRDAHGVEDATQIPQTHPMTKAIRQACFWLAIAGGIAVGSYLVAERALMPGIIVALTLASAWSVENILKFSEVYFAPASRGTNSRLYTPPNAPPDIDPPAGMIVETLRALDAAETAILSEINLRIEPGEIVGILGESGAGKSLLLKAIADPEAMSGLSISGEVNVNGKHIWRDQNQTQTAPVVFVPDSPIVIPTSGARNLDCYQGSKALTRGRYFLEQLVFAQDLVDKICDAPDARVLPSMQRKCLTLSRAFAIAPSVYLFDRPEDALQDAQISALCTRLETEARLGRSVLLISDNRAILDKCDRLIVMQGGSITDQGPAKDVRSRLDSGWHRFVGKRLLSTDASLEDWIRSHFRRTGDEDNRKKVARIAIELLALSCRDAQPDEPATVSFLFKNFRGHCILKMHDATPATSSTQIQTAQDIVHGKTPNTGRNPLANVMVEVEEIDFTKDLDGRSIDCKIATYDPRKSPQDQR